MRKGPLPDMQCRRRLSADMARVRALGSGDGNRAAGLALTIQIMAEGSRRVAKADESNVADALAG